MPEASRLRYLCVCWPRFDSHCGSPTRLKQGAVYPARLLLSHGTASISKAMAGERAGQTLSVVPRKPSHTLSIALLPDTHAKIRPTGACEANWPPMQSRSYGATSSAPRRPVSRRTSITIQTYQAPPSNAVIAQLLRASGGVTRRPTAAIRQATMRHKPSATAPRAVALVPPACLRTEGAEILSQSRLQS